MQYSTSIYLEPVWYSGGMQGTPRLDIGNNRAPRDDFGCYDRIIRDRGSVYSVSIGRVSSRMEIKTFLQRVKSQKGYPKATHHSYAARVAHEGALYETKQDDGETGAGMVILRILQKYGMRDTVVCVTRWFGGVKLHGDRFKHIQDATIYALEQEV